ncbi:hypothetical protein DLREEDagr8_42320 [Dongia sp. agr-C8]
MIASPATKAVTTEIRILAFSESFFAKPRFFSFDMFHPGKRTPLIGALSRMVRGKDLTPGKYRGATLCSARA